jgi:ABC-type multidrug transport system ATPase subunit
MKVLEITNLTKQYGRITAVNGLNLSVEEGQIYGILGPNGSGKTTTLGSALGIIRADNGNCRWFEGQRGEGAHALRHIGSLLETPNFYPYMNAVQNLEIVAHIKHAKNVDYDSILRLVNLAHRKDAPFKTYSLGMKQRLAIAATMVGDPSVLILDEPTNGLDPTGIAEVRETIRKIASEGKTIFMASHMLDEVEKVCTHVAIIKNGNLLTTGPVGSLLNKEITIEIAAQNLEILRGVLDESNFVSKIDTKANHLIISVKKGYSVFDVSELIYQKGIILTHLTEHKHRLEDEFLKITSKN